MADDNADELIAEFYGFDPVARRVDNVGIYASGKMAHWSERRGYVFHVLKDGGGREEIERIFKWTDVTELSPATPNHHRRQILDALQAKARGEQPKILESFQASIAPVESLE